MCAGRREAVRAQPVRDQPSEPPTCNRRRPRHARPGRRPPHFCGGMGGPAVLAGGPPGRRAPAFFVELQHLLWPPRLPKVNFFLDELVLLV